MKKIPQISIIYLPSLEFHIEDIREIDKFFRDEFKEAYKICVGENQLDSIEEIKQFDEDEPIAEIDFTNHGGNYLHLKINSKDASIATYDDALSIGLGTKLERIVLKAKRGNKIDPFKLKHMLVTTVLPLVISFLLTFTAYYLLAKHFRIRMGDYKWLLWVTWFVILLLLGSFQERYVKYRNKNIISLKSKKLRVSFVKRNKDKIILLIIGGIIGAIFTAIFSFIINVVLGS
jgi:hypothetical protein